MTNWRIDDPDAVTAEYATEATFIARRGVVSHRYLRGVQGPRMMRGGARAHTNVDRVVEARTDSLRGSSDVGLFGQLPTTLFLVDGNNLLWRAAHGPRAPFDADDGRDLTPLFRFVSMLRRALGTHGVFSECIVCFDGADAWASRLDVDGSYKSNRDYTDADLSFMGWLPEIRAALDCAGVTCIEVTDSEADDVIATLTEHAGLRPVRIMSTDRDYYQLIGPTTYVIDPRSRPAMIGEAQVYERYKVTPAQWCDFRALAGDPSDGIPGLAGIGTVRAATLLAGGKRLEDLRATEPAVAERWDDVCRWRDLVRLHSEVPLISRPSGDPTPRLPSASAICEELGLIPARRRR